jgi:hypothetical protein
MFMKPNPAMKAARAILGGSALAIGIVAASATAANAMTVASQGYGRAYGQGGYGGSDDERYGSRNWPGLTDDEIAALRAWLGPRAPLPVVLVYRPSGCAALKLSLARLFDGLDWPRADAQGVLMDENPEGLTLLPDNPNTRDLKDAIEAATPLPVEVRGDAPALLGTGEVIFVIGERPQQGSGRVVRSFDDRCK